MNVGGFIAPRSFFITLSFRFSTRAHLNAAASLSSMGFESWSLRVDAVVPPSHYARQ